MENYVIILFVVGSLLLCAALGLLFKLSQTTGLYVAFLNGTEEERGLATVFLFCCFLSFFFLSFTAHLQFPMEPAGHIVGKMLVAYTVALIIDFIIAADKFNRPSMH